MARLTDREIANATQIFPRARKIPLCHQSVRYSFGALRSTPRRSYATSDVLLHHVIEAIARECSHLGSRMRGCPIFTRDAEIVSLARINLQKSIVVVFAEIQVCEMPRGIFCGHFDHDPHSSAVRRRIPQWLCRYRIRIRFRHHRLLLRLHYIS